jgi:hypothetical protein
MLRVAEPGRALVSGSPYQDSDRDYQWGYTILEVLHRWTNVDISSDVDKLRLQVKSVFMIQFPYWKSIDLQRQSPKQKGVDVTHLLGIFKAHPDWVPGLRNPQGVYFLLSSANFLREWYDHLLPAISREEPEVVLLLNLNISLLTEARRRTAGARIIRTMLSWRSQWTMLSNATQVLEWFLYFIYQRLSRQIAKRSNKLLLTRDGVTFRSHCVLTICQLIPAQHRNQPSVLDGNFMTSHRGTTIQKNLPTET